MSPHAVSHLSSIFDSQIGSDAVLARARPANGPAIHAGPSSPGRVIVPLDVDPCDLEPKWLAAIDAATD
jgi:hypothetical protein